MAECPYAAGKDISPHTSSDHDVSKSKDGNPRKRKRPTADEQRCDRDSFNAVPLRNAAQKSKAVTFIPIASIPKPNFPLLWLEPSSPSTRVPSGSLFHASLPEHHTSGPATLVARLIPNDGLYAIDHVNRDAIVAYCLRSWVNEEQVKDRALGRWSPEQDLDQLLHKEDGESGKPTVQLLHVPQLVNGHISKRSPRKPKARKGALARLLILPTTSTPPAEAGTSSCSIRHAGSCLHGTSSALAGISNPSNAAVNLGESFSAIIKSPLNQLDLEELRRQYLETLYLSRTSLAYFAKGPLTRARNQIQSQIGGKGLTDLEAFYRDGVMTGKKFDLKFRKTIPNALSTNAAPRSAVDVPVPASDETPVVLKNRIDRKKKKIGKDGLYPGEVEYLMTSWQDREISNSLHVTADQLVQEATKFTTDIRTRESQMQVLLILECLTLGKLQASQDQISKEDPQIKEEPLENEALPQSAKVASKKRDLSQDLDTLIDRLCIWHTVGIDNMLAPPENQDAHTGHSSQVKDKLRDFCADVIIPFYASRIPERCKAVCKKLGGPEVSPDRPQPRKAASVNSAAPGTSVKNRPRGLAKRTLERVLSEDHSMRHVSPPLLSRSATAPQIPQLKREPSEASQRPASRGAMHKSVSFLNREVDLTADAKAQETKRNKMARLSNQKQELQAAINALRKPSRTVVAGGFMDDVERRIATHTDAVQIVATPRRRRPSNAVLESAVPRESLELTHETLVPSTAMRPREPRHNMSQPQLSTTKRAVLVTIHSTPSKRMVDVPQSRQRPTMPLLESTPMINRVRPDWLAAVESTPLKLPQSQRPLCFTPLKKANVRSESTFRDVPQIPEQAGKAMDRVMGGGVQVSIYESLGWDDDLDE